jgi:predicted acetyltransferase
MLPEIRRVRKDELAAYVEALSTAFLERPDAEKVAEELEPLWDRERTWAAIDGGRICGTFRSWATELTVPGGGLLPAAAVSAVTVLPSHRRRGILRAMVAVEHGAMRERGEAIALLHASEYPIYGRFGYGPAIRSATAVVDTRSTTLRRPMQAQVLVERPHETLLEPLREVGEAWRLRQPGEIRRRDYRMEFDLGLRESAWDGRWKGILAVHRDRAGKIDGYVRYRPNQKWEFGQPRGSLEVDDLYALTDEAHAALWQYLIESDWVATIRAERQSLSDRLPWLLTNARAIRYEDVGDGMWARLIDVRRALEGRTYEREDRLVLEVRDGEAVDGRLRLELDAGRGGATCRPTDRAPDLALDVGALGAAYLGGRSLRDAVLAYGGADEHREGALAAADALFRTLDEPRCSTFF